ncbi:hypothetical protein ABH17_028765 (plasmid) [Bacillus toyonensis]|nr:hypothetical protein ABH17_028765 [Bacillus toyonensis]
MLIEKRNARWKKTFLEQQPLRNNLGRIDKENDFVFQLLVHMGNASHYMAWENTIIEDLNVPENLKKEIISKVNRFKRITMGLWQ